MSKVEAEVVAGERLDEGERIGRFVVLRDREGTLHAVAAGAVGAICEVDDGSLLMLSAGRLLQVSQPLTTILRWLDGR